jgi:hypothetical protein
MSEEKTILEDITNEVVSQHPNEDEKLLADELTEKFRVARDERIRSYEYLDNRNVIDYIEDSVRRFTTNIDEREGLEDWQARVHDQITRTKVLAVLGKIVSVLPIASFIGRGEEDYRKGSILSALYEYAEEKDDYEEFMVYFLMEAIVKGTAIGYEDITTKKRKKRFVKGVGSDVSVTEKVIKNVDLPSYIVPLEEFYPASVGIRNVKKQPYCFWRSEISWEQFKSDWTMYARHDKVQPFQTFYGEDEVRPYYVDYISDFTEEGKVEILRYYDQDNDQFIIMANGIWLNPLETKNGFVAQPLPFNHKELPFFDVRYDFFGGDFFYGKSLPDRLSSWQDVLNALTNMLLDQSFLSIFPPMLMAGADDIEDDYLRPGRRVPYDTQGLPITSTVMKLDPGTPGGWHQFILEYSRSVMAEASVDQVSQGIAGGGDRTTAQEIRTAAAGANDMIGPFNRMVKTAIKRKAQLKGANILQAWTNPKFPIIQGLLTEDGAEETNKAFNTFKINNVMITGGKRGTKVIEIYKNQSDMPDKNEIKARALVSEKESGEKIEIDAITPDYIRNYEFDVKLVLNPASEGSTEVEKALQLEKVTMYQNFFPDMVDREELLAETAEKMGDDPSKIIKKDILNPPPPETVQQPGAGVAQNITNGLQGGGSAALGAQASQLTQ